MSMRLVRVLLYLFFCLTASMAHAGTCSALWEQIRSAEQGNSPHAAPLMKQLVAIRRLEKERQCSRRSVGGIFNPCRDLANRKAQVQAQLNKLGGRSAGKVTELRARFATLGCRASGRKRPRRKGGQKQQHHANGSLLFCVRLKDGYYFPAPNSQFVGSDSAENQLDRCRSICNTKDMQLYVLDSPSKSSEEMVSVKDGQAYTELPTAFRYREKSEFARCNFRDYHRTVAWARANEGKLSAYTNVVVPVPRQRPVVSTVKGEPQTMRSAEINLDQARAPIRIVLPFRADTTDTPELSAPATGATDLAERTFEN